MTELRFDGRVALITGGGRGMGRAHALLLASRGAKVVVNDMGVAMDGAGQSTQPAQEVVAEIRGKAGVAVADNNDVSTEHGADAMIRTAIDNFGRIDIVVHNAGIVTFIPFADMTYADYRRLVAVHQDGSFLIAKAAWPFMVKQNYGRLVFITSLAAMASLTHYASAKAAAIGFVRSLSAEGAPHDIRANALSVIAYTRMMAGYFDPGSSHVDVGLHGQHAIESWWRDHLRPEQVAQVMAWMAHEECDISGQTLFSAGGYVGLQFIGMTNGYASTSLTPEAVAAERQRICDTSVAPHVFDGGGLEGWLFERIVAGGAPPLPPLAKTPASRSTREPGIDVATSGGQ